MEVYLLPVGMDDSPMTEIKRILSLCSMELIPLQLNIEPEKGPQKAIPRQMIQVDCTSRSQTPFLSQAQLLVDV